MSHWVSLSLYCMNAFIHSQLHNAATSALTNIQTLYGLGSSPPLIGTPFCFGNENSLSECTSFSRGSRCSDGDIAGVICGVAGNQSCDTGSIRLVSGSTPYEGRLELCADNIWSTVCDDNFGANEAAVVCGQLGFNNSASKRGKSKYNGC